MGYSSTFKGTLKFKEELKGSEIAYLETFLGEDRRDIGYEDDSKVYEIGSDDYWYHIDLEFNKDYTGLKWNESEKSYGMPAIINFLLKRLKEQFKKDFILTGKMTVQGEEIDDRWQLIMVKNKAIKKDIKIVGDKITCPHCEEEFILEK